MLPDPGKRFSDTAERLEALASRAIRWKTGCVSWRSSLTPSQRRLTLPSLAPALEQSSSSRRLRRACRRSPRMDIAGIRLAGWSCRAARPFDGTDAGAGAGGHRGAARARSRRDGGLADRFLHGASNSPMPVRRCMSRRRCRSILPACRRLPVTSLRLLPQRGLCPCCGSTPSAGLVTGAGRRRGRDTYIVRYAPRRGTTSGRYASPAAKSRSISLEGIEGDPGIVKAETCNDATLTRK